MDEKFASVGAPIVAAPAHDMRSVTMTNTKSVTDPQVKPVNGTSGKTFDFKYEDAGGAKDKQLHPVTIRVDWSYKSSILICILSCLYSDYVYEDSGKDASWDMARSGADNVSGCCGP